MGAACVQQKERDSIEKVEKLRELFGFYGNTGIGDASKFHCLHSLSRDNMGRNLIQVV